MDKKIFDKMREIAEKFFKTANDPNQIPIGEESLRKFQKLHPKTIIYRTENNEPISWVVVLPTSNELADKFLRGEINEWELLDMTRPQRQYEALYFCAAFTIPEYRKKGFIIEMLKEAIDTIPHIKDVRIFTWPYSQEGRLLIEKLERVLDIKIELKK